MPTSTINIVIDSEDALVVEGYIRDTLDNADQEWNIESATIETDGITTDLLEDEEDLSDEGSESTSEVENSPEEETATEEGVDEEEDDTDETTRLPTGKEF